MSDKELCESAKKAGEESKAALITIMKSGKEPSAADYKKMLTEMGETLTTLASAGGDSKVATAIRQMGAEASKAAAASNPEEAVENPAFEKAGADLTDACKTTGINVNF
ncbi:MAG TPA: hypothetical protein VFX60_17605 [Micromonospora sp.]|nr:hypothetical protein [Micromonospora sp.]